jgi:signal transduction histidine kinase
MSSSLKTISSSLSAKNRMADEIDHDITGQKSSVDDVARLQGFLKDILNSLPSIFFVVDRDGLVRFWNDYAVSSTGILPDYAVGMPADSLLPDFSDYLQLFSDVIDGKIPKLYERVAVYQAGAERVYNVQIYPLVTEGSDRAVVRIDDVSSQARVESLMVRTEKMIMANGIAAGLAHEINNPLGAIMQLAQNMERRMLSDLPANVAVAAEVGLSLDSMRAYLEKRGVVGFISQIREAGARMSRIITNMHKFSSMTEPVWEMVCLADIVDQALELARDDYAMKKHYDFRDIDLVRDYQLDLPLVRITVSEIEQVLLSLLKNAAQALQAVSHQHPRIIVRVFRDGAYAAIEVIDNGPGMDNSVKRRIFEPFFSAREVGGGVGLGLSVSYAIITNNHNGYIDVSSQPGQGSCFKVRLPFDGR